MLPKFRQFTPDEPPVAASTPVSDVISPSPFSVCVNAFVLTGIDSVVGLNDCVTTSSGTSMGGLTAGVSITQPNSLSITLVAALSTPKRAVVPNIRGPVLAPVARIPLNLRI